MEQALSPVKPATQKSACVCRGEYGVGRQCWHVLCGELGLEVLQSLGQSRPASIAPPLRNTDVQLTRSRARPQPALSEPRPSCWSVTESAPTRWRALMLRRTPRVAVVQLVLALLRIRRQAQLLWVQSAPPRTLSGQHPRTERECCEKRWEPRGRSTPLAERPPRPRQGIRCQFQEFLVWDLRLHTFLVDFYRLLLEVWSLILMSTNKRQKQWLHQLEWAHGIDWSGKNKTLLNEKAPSEAELIEMLVGLWEEEVVIIPASYFIFFFSLFQFLSQFFILKNFKPAILGEW